MDKKDIIKNTYFSNWSDTFGYPIAYALTKHIAKVKYITPNIVTVFAFLLYTLGCLSLFIKYPLHNYFAASLIFAGYIGDDIDGQLARYKNLISKTGDYLDKVLDVLKIYIITLSLSWAVYLNTNNILHLILGFTCCFFFLFRYYIKLETMFSKINDEPGYLKKSARVRSSLISRLAQNEKKLSGNISGKLKLLWQKNRTLLFLDEAEIAMITALGSIFNRLELSLIIITVFQIAIGVWRFYERGIQLQKSSPNLYRPMRK